MFFYFSIDSPLHKKVCTAPTNKRLMKGIMKAALLAQTSCLEGFHSMLTHFAPKRIAYCFVGQYCRLETQLKSYLYSSTSYSIILISSVKCIANYRKTINCPVVVCRHIIAVIHFSYNLQKEIKRNDSDDSERVKINYPKFKNGEATVQNMLELHSTLVSFRLSAYSNCVPFI